MTFRELLMPSGMQPPAQFSDIDPGAVRNYAPYLRRLGLKLKRRGVPRVASIVLDFSEQQIPASKPEFPYRIRATISTKKEIVAGYIVVQLSGRLAWVAAPDFEGSTIVSSIDDIENGELSKLLTTMATPTNHNYALKIGKAPFTSSKPFHIEAYGREAVHITKATWFDE
jgi:hypothetical protein